MMNPPSVNQITSAYQGNPAPLAKKVEQDKKQNGGIPSDLRQLLALNDINQMRQGAGIQAALNAPTNMPTVAEDVQAKAKQALQARMVQEAQKQMAKDGRPGIIPFGVPQPRPQPEERGIDSLASNVGESYAMGGVVAFQEGGTPPDTRSADDILREQMRVNEEVKRQAAIDRQKAEVGAPDTAQIDRLVAELEGRKAKLAAPKPGYDAMMEYLAQIANAPVGARSNWQAGSYGAQQQNALQKAREGEQNTLTEKMIDLAQRKSDTGYQYKKDLFQTGNVAAESAIKQKYDAAIQVARTDQDKARLAQEKEFELKKLAIERDKIGVMRQPAVGIQVANMLMETNKGLSKEEALRQGFLIAQGGDLKTQQLDVRKIAEFQDAKSKIDKAWEGKIGAIYETVPPKNEKQAEQYKRWKETKDAEIEKVRSEILKKASGGLPEALAAQATPSAPPTAGGYTVMAGGKVYNFPTQAAADAFKQASGAK
jgi:hypothetical protein